MWSAWAHARLRESQRGIRLERSSPPPSAPAAPMIRTTTSAQRIEPGDCLGVVPPTSCADGEMMTGPEGEGLPVEPPVPPSVLVAVADAPAVGPGVAVDVPVGVVVCVEVADWVAVTV